MFPYAPGDDEHTDGGDGNALAIASAPFGAARA